VGSRFELDSSWKFQSLAVLSLVLGFFHCFVFYASKPVRRQVIDCLGSLESVSSLGASGTYNASFLVDVRVEDTAEKGFVAEIKMTLNHSSPLRVSHIADVYFNRVSQVSYWRAIWSKRLAGGGALGVVWL